MQGSLFIALRTLSLIETFRGWIPAMLPFGIVEIFTSTLDFVTLYKTFDIYARAVVGELLQGKI
jgi:hypothetical protein